MAATISDLYIQIKAETGGFSAGAKMVTKDAGGMATKVIKGLGHIGLAIQGVEKLWGIMSGSIRAVTDRVFEHAEGIDELSKSARDLNLTYAELQGARLFAAEAGVDSVDKLLQTANRRFGQFIALGSGPAKDALEQLGVTADQLQGEDLFGQIDLVTDRMRDMGMSAQEMQATMGLIFGRTASADAMRLFAEGTAGLEGMTAEMEAMGALSDSQARDVEIMNDAWGRVQQQVKTTWENITAALAPAMTAVAQVVMDIIGDMRQLAAVVGADEIWNNMVDSFLDVLEVIRRELIPWTVEWISVIASGIEAALSAVDKLQANARATSAEWGDRLVAWWNMESQIEDRFAGHHGGTRRRFDPEEFRVATGLSDMLDKFSRDTGGLADEIRRSNEGGPTIREILEGLRDDAEAADQAARDRFMGELSDMEQKRDDSQKEQFPRAVEEGSVAAQDAINRIQAQSNTVEQQQLAVAQQLLDAVRAALADWFAPDKAPTDKQAVSVQSGWWN